MYPIGGGEGSREVIDTMLEHKVGAIPIVDPSAGDLLGIVSYIDVLRALAPDAD